MSEKKSKTVDSGHWLLKVFEITSKISVLLLFLFMFVGRFNPARISGAMKSNVSLVKSALYFKGYTSDILNLENQKSDSAQDSDIQNDSDSYDDFYSNFAAMVESSASFEISEDDDFETSASGGKLKVSGYSSQWNRFAALHPQIAEALKYSHIVSIFSFIAVLICVAGIYLSMGKGKIKLAGLCSAVLGSVFVIVTMFLYGSGYSKISAAVDSLNILPQKPEGILVYIFFSIILIISCVALFLLEFLKKENDFKTALLEKSELNEKPFQITFRILTLLLFVLLFIPGTNPARISTNISRNVSLFTSGFSYGTYIKNMERILIRGWLPYSVMRLSFASSLFACLGIFACCAGSCMSVGNNKLKRYGHFCLLVGSVVSFVSLFGILHSYNLILSSENVEKISPLEPASLPMFFIILSVIFICALLSFLKTPAPEKDEKCHIEAPLQLFLMILPFLILVFLFSYLPLWGWRYAFFDYNAGDTLSMEKWVGLKWFKAPFENAATRSDILRVLKNTLAMSGLGIAFSWLPMFFAVFLSEIKNTHARKVIQTLTTIPNFISWVLVYAIAFCIFGTEGFISSIFVQTGIWEKGKNMLMGDHLIWLKMWLWGTWKGLGWSAIMYIAAISGIDQQLYEAATVDGAGRFQKIWHITIPELFPTYIVLLILSVSNILSNGMDQYLVFKNPTNKNPIEVLDLYVYQLSFGQTSNSNIPFSTVVSMFKSLVSVVLLFVTNKISKWVRGSSIF